MAKRRSAGFFKKVRGRWKRFRGNPLRRNVAMGFYDKVGKFHPIRKSSDYDEGRVGGGGRRRTKKRTTRRKKHTAAKKRRR